MEICIPEQISRKELNKGIREGRIVEETETEWAKDAEGIARPVGTIVTGYKGRKTGKYYIVEDEYIINLR